MANPEIETWNLHENTTARNGLKDIQPGDQVDQRQAMNEAYAKMGNAMASEMRSDAEYKEDTKNMLNNIGVISGQVGVSESFDDGKHSLSTNPDKGILEYFIFLIASIVGIIFKPRLHKPTVFQLILGILTTLALIMVIVMVLHDNPQAVFLLK